MGSAANGCASESSTRSFACATEAAKLAALEQRAAVLAERQALEMERACIAARVEKLALETALAEKRAQFKFKSPVSQERMA